MKEFVKVGEKTKVVVKMPLNYATGYWDENREMWRGEKGIYGVRVCTSTTATA